MTWQEIPNYTNYVVNEKGEVKNRKTERILKPFLNTGGYYSVGLYNNKKYGKIEIHRILAVVFINNPENLPFVDHKDRNILNNSLDNLRWVSYLDSTLNRTIINKYQKYSIYKKSDNCYQVIYFKNKRIQKKRLL
jgi:hypothetical protein